MSSLRIALLALGFASLAASAQAFTTTITADAAPAGVDRLEIHWFTEQETGAVTAADLSYLKFEIYGSADPSLVMVEDIAILGGLAQDLGGLDRTLDDLSFSFDLDAWALDPGQGLTAFDNDAEDEASYGGDAMLLTSGGAGTWAFELYVGGGGGLRASYDGPAEAVTFVPLPAPAALLGAGLLALGGLRRSRRAPQG